MSQEIVGLARKDGRLVAIVSGASQEHPEATVRFDLREEPAAGATAELRPSLRRAVAAWTGLREADWDDPRVLASALTVLIETVPLGCGSAGPGLPARSVLCAPDAWRRLRDALLPREARVLRLLRRAGHGPQVAMLAHARDPYVAYHHRAPAEPGLAALPARFVAFVLTLLRARPWADVRRALAVYWGLGLQQDDASLALAVRLLALGREHGLSWLEWMAGEEPTRREILGRVLLETGALARDPRALPARTLEVLAEEGGAEYADRSTMLLRGLREGADVEYLLEGVRAARQFAPASHRFTGLYGSLPAFHRRVPTRVTSDLWRVLSRLQEAFAPEWRSALPVELWDWCVSSPVRAAILRRPAVLDWPAPTTLYLLDLLLSEAPAGMESECVAVAERLVPRIPASHQPKAVDAVFTLLREGRIDPQRLAFAGELIVRMARRPFRSIGCGEAVPLLMAAAGARPHRLAHVPERSLRRLEQALCNEASSALQRGMRSLAHACGGFLLDALTAHPEQLFSAARRLGLLSEPRRRSLLKRFRAHPVSQRRFTRLPLERVCRTIEGLVRRGLPNPIPRKLREHREGAIDLSADSLERHRQGIVRQIVSLRLALLVRMALEDLDRGVNAGLSSESERHALQMLGAVGANRRLLRRVLRTPAAARGPFLEEHPANRAWLRRHPRVDPEAWRVGLVEVMPLPDGRRVTLALEPDPVEVLRMGTLVGSCLGVDGCHNDSAVAVMADVNKRVVVARNAKGAFVARQLVAIAEDDRLVCFAVYPARSGATVEQAFARYDRALAARLGLEVHGPPPDDYRIAEVLARGFYDDGSWFVPAVTA